jgi:ATP-dependent exoDNAse (exonuclease V) beta subunit
MKEFEIRKTLRDIEKRISFEQNSHIYLYMRHPCISVTTIIAHFQNIFDYGDNIAKRKAEERGVEVATIKAEWKEKGKRSREDGTYVHSQLEDWFYNKSHHDFDLDNKKVEAGINYLASLDGNLIAVEQMVAHPNYLVAGTVDFIVYNNDGTISLGDWKTNEEITDFSYNKKMRGGLGHLNDCNLYHYMLQLSIYKYILQTYFKIEVRDIFLVHLKSDGTYEKRTLDYLPAEAEYILKSNVRDDFEQE